MTFSRFSFPTRRSSTFGLRRRRLVKKSRRGSRKNRVAVPSLATEFLEPRAMLAVTAAINNGHLEITYNAAGDLAADISSDGTEYTVSGTGLAATTFKISDITGFILVEDKASLAAQVFKVNAGTALANPLQVNANVEATDITGGITTAVAGDVIIGSAAISLANDISTAATKDNIVFTGATLLASGVALSTGAGAGDIVFQDTLDGGQDLSLTAGTGNVIFTGAVGGGIRLGAISIASATDVTANAITAASLDQAAGSGTTTLNGAVDTDGAAGVSLTGTNLAVNAGITTANAGPVTFVQSGTIAIAAAGDILADGAVSMKADGGISTAGDVTTTDDNVTFVSKTTLLGPVVIDTGAGAGDISFQDTLDGPFTLDLTAGTGAISLAGAVGATTPLAGIKINSAASTTFGSTAKLDGSAAGAFSDGLFIAAGVNKVTLNTAGSEIFKFANGVYFDGGSTDTTISKVAIFQNVDGVFVQEGDYSGTTISLNEIYSNTDDGIQLDATNLALTGLNVSGNFIGVRADLVTDGGNGQHGIQIDAGDYTGTVIQSNAIAYNDEDGILTKATATDAVTNLTIGGDRTAVPALGNAIFKNDSDGIQANDGDYTGTVIQGNAISANVGEGILLNTNDLTLTNLTIGAGIGGDVVKFGNAIFSNTLNGIFVEQGTYTGSVIGDGNQIYANTLNGIELEAGDILDLPIVGNTTIKIGNDGNTLHGILVGAGDYSGSIITLNQINSNLVDGIHLAAAGTGVTNLPIGGNTIDNNGSDGIHVENGDFTGTAIQSNGISGNFVEGIYLAAAGDVVTNLTIGGDKTAAPSLGNAISGNGSDGIQADDGDYTGTVIHGNTISSNAENGIFLNANGAALTNLPIGPGVGGDAKLANTIFSNQVNGILVGSKAGDSSDYSGTVIGEHNEILSNATNGIEVAAGGATDLLIRGNKIGTLADGTTSAGNSEDGIRVNDGVYTGTVIRNNSIAFNQEDGIQLAGNGNQVTGLLIGGDKAVSSNLIYDNFSDGIQADAADYDGSKIQGNQIYSNFDNGIFLNASSNAPAAVTNLLIGGPGGPGSFSFGNLIGLKSDNQAGNGNFFSGIYANAGDYTDTKIASNTIGYNFNDGIELEGAQNLLVGGPTSTDPNTIVRNFDAGVSATGNSTGTVVRGNLIDRNEFGVQLDDATGILIGGDSSIAANTITGNKSVGVEATGTLTDSKVHGNIITGSPTGVALVNARSLAIGGTLRGEGNRIHLNTQGLTAQGDSAGTTVRGNTFDGNDVGAQLIAATGLEVGNGDNTDPFARNVFDDNPTGITASGLLAGTTIHGNLIQTGITGISLDNAQELTVGGTKAAQGNSVQFQTTNGLSATGLLDGTVVSANTFANNYVGATLQDAKNIVVGGTVGNNFVSNTKTGVTAFGDLAGSELSNNTLISNESGIVLHDLLGPGDVLGLTVSNNTVLQSQKNGIFATGDLAGTVITNNEIENTGTIYSHASTALVNARNVVFGQLGAGNKVVGGVGAGLYTEGDLSGTTVAGNEFSQTRSGIVLANTTDAVFEDNLIVGGGNPAAGEYRDGVFSFGDLAGTTFTRTAVADTWIGVSLNATRNLTAAETLIEETQGIGFYAAGDSTGTVFTDLAVLRATTPTIDTSGGVLVGATDLTLQTTVFIGDTTGLFVFNDSTGTLVTDSVFQGLVTSVGLFNATDLSFSGNLVNVLQTGLYASGIFTGTTVVGTIFDGASAAGTTAIGLVSSQNLSILSNTIINSTTGVYATGAATGTVLATNSVDGNVDGVSLTSVTDISFTNNTISNSTATGLVASGLCTGSTVLNTTWTDNATNVVNKATGLTINPPAP